MPVGNGAVLIQNIWPTGLLNQLFLMDPQFKNKKKRDGTSPGPKPVRPDGMCTNIYITNSGRSFSAREPMRNFGSQRQTPFLATWSQEKQKRNVWIGIQPAAPRLTRSRVTCLRSKCLESACLQSYTPWIKSRTLSPKVKR